MNVFSGILSSECSDVLCGSLFIVYTSRNVGKLFHNPHNCCLGAYGAIMDEDSAGDKFCEEDIDQILERRTQIITLESEKGSTFSKASFASSGIRSDIDIDDPDFWKKWAKKAEIDTVEESDKVTEPSCYSYPCLNNIYTQGTFSTFSLLLIQLFVKIDSFPFCH
jgi:hypothetical protein